MKRSLILFFALFMCIGAFAQGFRVDNLGNRNIIVRIDDMSKRFLLVPVQESVAESAVYLTIDGVAEPRRDIKLAIDKIDYMVPIDLAPYKGKVVALDIHIGGYNDRSGSRKEVISDICWSKMTLSDEFDVTNVEKYRPAFHHSPQYGWMNDPNGMFWHDGAYHLYYQYNPYGSIWGNMHWGHSVSKDLIHWEHLPVAIAPDQWGTIFSGSAVVDTHNTSGFGENAVVAMYTSCSLTQKQSIAYSTDGGVTFTKYEGNPVITAPVECRDPKMFWNEDAQCWNCVLVSPLEYEVWFYSSKDLKNWTKEGEFGGHGMVSHIWECPDMIKVKDPVSGETKWILIVNVNPGGPAGGSATQYFVGDFDGKNFTCSSAPEVTNWLDYGKDHYATVSWSGAPDSRAMVIAWMSNWQYANQLPTMQFRSANSVPRDLGVFKDKNGQWRVSVVPSPEMDALRSGKPAKYSFTASSKPRTYGLPSSLCEVEVSFTCPEGSSLCLSFANEDGEHADLIYDGNEYAFDRSESGIVDFSLDFPVPAKAPASGEKVQSVRLIMDVSSIEMFDAAGYWAMTELVFPNKPYNRITVSSTNGRCKVLSLNIYKLGIE